MNLEASNGVSGDGGVSATHMGRSVDVVERGCEEKGLVIGGAVAEESCSGMEIGFGFEMRKCGTV